MTTLAMTLAGCILLSAYYLLKTVREPLILLQGGAGKLAPGTSRRELRTPRACLDALPH
jgi:hypothetical protein